MTYLVDFDGVVDCNNCYIGDDYIVPWPQQMHQTLMLKTCLKSRKFVFSFHFTISLNSFFFSQTLPNKRMNLHNVLIRWGMVCDYAKFLNGRGSCKLCETVPYPGNPLLMEFQALAWFNKSWIQYKTMIFLGDINIRRLLKGGGRGS